EVPGVGPGREVDVLLDQLVAEVEVPDEVLQRVDPEVLARDLRHLEDEVVERELRHLDLAHAPIVPQSPGLVNPALRVFARLTGWLVRLAAKALVALSPF